jgi:hypothetical protein
MDYLNTSLATNISIELELELTTYPYLFGVVARALSIDQPCKVQ